MNFWNKQRVLLTGGHGFLGKQVLQILQTKNCELILHPRRQECDLLDPQAIQLFLKKHQPTCVIHLAAVCGGIGANQENPGRFFYENALMGIQLIEKAREFNVQKMVVLGTVCAYPKWTPTPFQESDLWNGYPEETNAPYGLAKKMLLVQLQAYRQQYQFPGIYLLPVNLYGPNDHTDPAHSHVIPALIRKMFHAKLHRLESITLWGTGQASREFLYVEDCAKGVLLATEHYNSPEPINLGSGKSITIRDLSLLIAETVGYKGKMEWDHSKPDGQPQRQLDISRAQKAFGFTAQTSFRDGIKKTVDWFLENQNKL